MLQKAGSRTDRNVLYTFVALEILLFPPSCKHVAKVIASSIAWLAPLPEDGRNECALSPTCTTWPAGEVQLSQRSRHISFQWMMVPFGAVFMIAATAGCQPGASRSITLRTSAGSTSGVQDSDAEPSSLYVDEASVVGLHFGWALPRRWKGTCSSIPYASSPNRLYRL